MADNAVTVDTNTPDPNTPPANQPGTPPASPPITLGDNPNEPAPKTPASPPADDGTITYEATGDVGLDVALAFVGRMGIAADTPAMQAAANGDFSLIKAQLATMGDKAAGWEQMVALAEGSFTRSADAAKANNAAVTAAVHAVAGSAEAWAPIQAWASANADAAEKAAINSMLNAGPVQARAAAMMLMDAYSQANGTVVTPAKATTNTTGATQAAASHGPLSPRQFADESQVLRAKLGGRFEESAEYKALATRALAFRG